MTPVKTLVGMWLVETRKILTQGSGIAAIVVAAALGILAVLAMQRAGTMADGAVINGQPVQGLLTVSGPTAMSWALKARNFFVLPLLLLLCTGASVAGEISEHTLRETLVRPVSRTTVLLVKLAALLTLSAITLVLTGLFSAIPGAALFGATGEWGPLLLGYAASWLTDAGLLSLGILACLWIHSSGGAVVGVALFLMADGALRGVLWLAARLGATGAETIGRWMPGSALSAWEGYADAWTPSAFAGLGVLLAATLCLSLFRFSRMDIP